jgi:putative Ca2+/H+ antiporter (TMEM165/GDT1 family)
LPLHCGLGKRRKSGHGALHMEAFITSAIVVALAEMGDKTQLLAIVLTARFRKPVPIVAGILLATIANHAIAAWFGATASEWLEGLWFRYAVAASFIAMGVWTLVPDKLDDEEEPKAARFGAFLTTLVSFFLVEIGDKTQIATVALAARYQEVWAVAAGTTAGMLLANGPVVLAGAALVDRIPLKPVRIAAAVLFVGLGLVMLWQLLVR